MLARATLTEELQGSSNAQCSSKGQHTFQIDEEDPGVLAGRPAGVRHVTCLLYVFSELGCSQGGFTFPSPPDMADKDASNSVLESSLT